MSEQNHVWPDNVSGACSIVISSLALPSSKEEAKPPPEIIPPPRDFTIQCCFPFDKNSGFSRLNFRKCLVMNAKAFREFSEKRTTLPGTPKFSGFFSWNLLSIWFPTPNFSNFSWNGSLFRNLAIFAFSGNIPRNCLAICARFKNIGIFG